MATKNTETDTGWLVAKETFLFFHGARPPVYRKWIDRDRRTGALVEKELRPPEGVDPIPKGYEPIDPGTEGDVYTIVRGEKYPADHVAVRERPAQFLPCSPP
jgi:hypothetical protein